MDQQLKWRKIFLTSVSLSLTRSFMAQVLSLDTMTQANADFYCEFAGMELHFCESKYAAPAGGRDTFAHIQAASEEFLYDLLKRYQLFQYQYKVELGSAEVVTTPKVCELTLADPDGRLWYFYYLGKAKSFV